MRSIIVVCVLAAVTMASAGTVPYPQGCRYINGRCVEACPVGTHAYALGCDYRTPEATCREPNPVQEKYQLCDYSSCYCDAPTVRDETTKKCVQLADCPPPSKPDQPNESSATPPPAKQPDQPNESGATPAPAKQPDQPNESSATPPPAKQPDQPNESSATPPPAKQPDQPNDASATATAIATAFVQN